MTDFNKEMDEIAKALEAADMHRTVVLQIMTLGAEYEAKTISADRFADRVLDILRRQYTKFVQTPAAPRSPEEK
jgi:hypothetical protein